MKVEFLSLLSVPSLSNKKPLGQLDNNNNNDNNDNDNDNDSYNTTLVRPEAGSRLKR